MILAISSPRQGAEHMGYNATSSHETGWYFPGALDPGEDVNVPEDECPYPDSEDMILLIEQGIREAENEANAMDPSPLTAQMDVVDRPRSVQD